MEYKRIQLTPSERFCILKRDNFRCQYCGRPAPEVSLEVDHIVPVSKGGDNNPENLITACSDCNLGKGTHLIEEPTNIPYPFRPSVLMELLKECAEELDELKEWRKKADELLERQLDEIEDMLFQISHYYRDKYKRKDVRQKICKYGFEEVYVTIREEALKDTSDEEFFMYQPSFLHLMATVESICADRRKADKHGIV